MLRRLVSDFPIFATQPLDAPKLRKIACDDYQSATSRVTGNQHVVTADWSALSLKVCSDVSGMGGSVTVEVEHFQARRKGLYVMAIFDGARGLCRAVDQFVQNY